MPLYTLQPGSVAEQNYSDRRMKLAP